AACARGRPGCFHRFPRARDAVRLKSTFSTGTAVPYGAPRSRLADLRSAAEGTGAHLHRFTSQLTGARNSAYGAVIPRPLTQRPAPAEARGAAVTGTAAPRLCGAFQCSAVQLHTRWGANVLTITPSRSGEGDVVGRRAWAPTTPAPSRRRTSRSGSPARSLRG